jgi:hypothetical protein
MVHFTAAVTAALAATIDPVDGEIYCHLEKLEVLILCGTSNAPKLVQQLLQQMKADETNISFRGASLEAIDTELFPLTNKPIFDTLFCSYSTKNTNREFIGSPQL